MAILEKRPLGTRALSWANPFDRFLKDFAGEWNGDTPLDTIPSINIREEKDNYKVEMAAPGLKKDDFHIDIEGDIMSISCHKESEEEKEDKQGLYSRREYNYAAFSRSFTLPRDADAEKTSARYEDGILHVTVPKKQITAETKNQKIRVG